MSEHFDIGSFRRTHGATAGGKYSPTYISWLAMRARCKYPKNSRYHRYGGRGITVCERWDKSFSAFVEDMGERQHGTTLDRRDNDGPYCKENCRWATHKQQMENRTRESFASNSRKTHCPEGHPYSGSNVRFAADGRKCRECDRLRARYVRAAARNSGKKAWEVMATWR